MKKILFTICAIAICLLPATLQAQDAQAPAPIDDRQKTELVDSILSEYYPWDTISMSGKLSSSMLPVTASVKIYMERDKLLLISISAPLIGEAARIEIDQNEVLMVNKLSKSFTTLEMERIEPIFPGGLSTIQNLLLGRISIFGKGELNASDIPNLDVYRTEAGNWLILPNQDLENAPFVYFYNINAGNLRLDEFTVMTQPQEGAANCRYEWDARSMTIAMTSAYQGKGMDATLKLNNPDKSTKTIDRIELKSNYKETDFKGLLR